MVSCDGDSDSSQATGSCSPGDSVHDVPRGRQRRQQRVSRSLFPTSSADVVGSVQPAPRTADERHSPAPVVTTPLTGWRPSPLLVDRRSAAPAAVLPELLGSDAYCRLAAAAAASIAGIYWGRRCDEKSGVELTLPWHTAAAAAAAGFCLPTLASNYAPAADNPVGAMSLLSAGAVDRSSWLGLATHALPTDRLEPGKAAATPDRSASPSSVDDLPLDLSPVSKRVRVKSALTNSLAVDDRSI